MEDKPQSNASWKEQLRGPLSYLLLGLLAVVVVGILYFGARFLFHYQGEPIHDASGELQTSSHSALEPSPVLKDTSEHFRQVAKKVGPAVVNIKSSRNTKNLSRNPHDEVSPNEEMPQDPSFDFFEQFGRPFFPPPEQAPQVSLGSGILLDQQGHIVTNNHVIEGGTEIIVTVGDDKTEIKAKVIGSDPKTDIAVLKLMNLQNLPTPPEWANSETVEVGDWAIAIGSPFALGQSVTVGIVSAKGRRTSVAMGGSDMGSDLLQTDAAINPGNSGGPLCDLDGKIIGLNTAIYTRNGGYMGIGFAIPSNVVKEIGAKLLRDGKIIRGWLGVYIQPLDPELARDLGVKFGVEIHQVVEKGPAATAGLRAGDVILEVDGNPTKEITDLQRTISGFKPGQIVKLKVVSYASKKTRVISVKIGELPDKVVASHESATGETDRLGLVVEAVKGKQGVLVRSVQPESIAESVGIEPGDLLTRVNRKPIDGLETYTRIISSASWVSLELKRKGQTLFFQFSLNE